MYVDVCGTGKRLGFFFFFLLLLACREGEWKWAVYRMKASEDYPLTMKFDDPLSPSDAQRVQPDIALGSKTPEPPV